MKQFPLSGIPDLFGEERYAHGGNLRKLAGKAGCPVDKLLDFSVSVNPLGPPGWLGQEIGRTVSQVGKYPDPDSLEFTLAACERFKVWPKEVVAGNGASELLQAVTMLGGVRQAVIPSPAYVDYTRACGVAGLPVSILPLSPDDEFRLDLDRLEARLTMPSLVFACQPNNPTGQTFNTEDFRALALRHPDCRFLVDESFADFVPGLDRLTRNRPENVIVLHSLTKFYAIPGLRLGLAFAAPKVVERIRKYLPPWSVNALAQRVGERCLRDAEYAEQAVQATRELRENLVNGLRKIPGLKVFPSQANFVLCRMDRVGLSAGSIFERLLHDRMAVRLCHNFQGLDETYFRVAVRPKTDNARLIKGLKAISGIGKALAVRKPKRPPAIMIQGTSSNSGKSILAAALCRIFLQDGLRVAPFKAQNMSLNSFVTRDGCEMGRAQATQAMACRLAPEARMNPVLLKPGSDIGSQVIVMGKPVGNMTVKEYVEFKPRAFEVVKETYDSLASEFDVMVLEGAGSPAEINLKSHDIVNMKMAQYADAKVLLVGDIDRGGVFAALVGTMELLDDEERKLVSGYVVNKFRGDRSLLDPALSFLFERTGKQIFGVVPMIQGLGLPEEDSVSFKNGITPGNDLERDPEQCVDIACIDLPRISNFNDLDPLFAEPDVNLRVVSSAFDLGTPDAVIIPGSKSTVTDMRTLKGAGMAAAIRSLPESTEIIGICGGFQMLGSEIHDPHGLESDSGSVDGFGLLDMSTTLAQEKTLTRTLGTHARSGLTVYGYEIHHGRTQSLDSDLEEAVKGRREPLGLGLKSGRVWGTYLHGLFDSDEFRRWFIDSLRVRKGLEPLVTPQTTYDLEAALDHLASVVRQHLDMPAIYRDLGFASSGQANLFYHLGRKDR